MPRFPKPDSYFGSVNDSLLRAVPAAARRILDVGCGSGEFGAALKARDPGREVFGIERAPGPARLAAGRLDRVFAADAERCEPPLDAGSLDCVVYGDVLGHLADPEAVLLRHRRLLRPGGSIVCSVSNVQHHSLLAAVCTGDFQYAESGALDDARVRFFSRSTLIKLLLDTGFLPNLVEILTRQCPPALWEAAQPLLRHFRVSEQRARRHLGAYQFVFHGTLVGDGEGGGRPPHEVDHRTEPPLSFVACVSDEDQLRANLLSSPCFRPGSPHELRLIQKCPDAAAGLNFGIAKARHEWVVCLHQDVYLPAGWPTRFWRQVRLATERFGPLGVAGVFGSRGAGERQHLVGHFVHQYRPHDSGGLPARVDTLDELLLAVPRGTPLRFEPSLGWHFYGSDICLAARRQGLAAVALDAVCYHNTRTDWYPEGFAESGAVFARKWADALPLATPCIFVEADGRLRVPPGASRNGQAAEKGG